MWRQWACDGGTFRFLVTQTLPFEPFNWAYRKCTHSKTVLFSWMYFRINTEITRIHCGFVDTISVLPLLPPSVSHLHGIPLACDQFLIIYNLIREAESLSGIRFLRLYGACRG